jgi:glycosyltransferase involved in cell wall biosynthesis
MKIRCSVIIPSYNSEKTILQCLQHLFAQDLNEPFEVIVVDSSQDVTSDLIAENYPQVKLIHREEKTDQGRARNIGVDAAAGEFILFLDSDCLVPPHWISTMIQWQDKGYEAVGGPIWVANDESSIAWAGYLMEFSNILPEKEPREVWHLPSGNVCYRRSFLDEYGPYPENLNFALEDCLFHASLREKGIKMILDPHLAVKHFQRDTFLSFMKHQFILARGQCQMMRKVPLEGSKMVHHPWLIGIWVLPFLPLVKFFRTSLGFYAWNRKLFFRKPLILPCLAIGVLPWMFGMGREMLKLK